MSGQNIAVVVPWHDQNQIEKFLQAWNLIHFQIEPLDKNSWLILQQDVKHEGGARTKNKGVREAIRRGADVVVILDDDCFPTQDWNSSLYSFAQCHADNLNTPVEDCEFQLITEPPSRGTPYFLSKTMPVCCSLGFWTEQPDYDAVNTLAHGPRHLMKFNMGHVFGRYFPLCGMNMAFRPKDWLPWCEFIEGAARFDDIWMGWLWQHEAYRRGYCFSLNGPLVRHVRQSNVWRNLRDEVVWLEKNETLWKEIARSEKGDYKSLRGLLPT